MPTCFKRTVQAKLTFLIPPLSPANGGKGEIEFVGKSLSTFCMTPLFRIREEEVPPLRRDGLPLPPFEETSFAGVTVY